MSTDGPRGKNLLPSSNHNSNFIAYSNLHKTNVRGPCLSQIISKQLIAYLLANFKQII